MKRASGSQLGRTCYLAACLRGGRREREDAQRLRHLGTCAWVHEATAWVGMVAASINTGVQHSPAVARSTQVSCASARLSSAARASASDGGRAVLRSAGGTSASDTRPRRGNAVRSRSACTCMAGARNARAATTSGVIANRGPSAGLAKFHPGTGVGDDEPPIEMDRKIDRLYR